MRSIEKSIPAPAVHRAIEIINHQGPTPESPGSMTPSGKVTFCAAAALAAAGFELRGEHERLSALKNDIVSSNSITFLQDAFSGLGWSIDLCNSTVRRNNTLIPSQRTQGVTDYLQTLL